MLEQDRDQNRLFPQASVEQEIRAKLAPRPHERARSEGQPRQVEVLKDGFGQADLEQTGRVLRITEDILEKRVALPSADGYPRGMPTGV